MSHEEFFARCGQWEPVADTGYDQKARFTVEAMYQAFKARLIAELLVDVHNCPVYGRLVPKDES